MVWIASGTESETIYGPFFETVIFLVTEFPLAEKVLYSRETGNQSAGEIFYPQTDIPGPKFRPRGTPIRVLVDWGPGPPATRRGSMVGHPPLGVKLAAKISSAA